MEREAGSEQGSPESEMGDNDSVGYGAEMDVDGGSGSAGAAPVSSASAYVARAGAYDGVDPFEGMEFDDEEDAWTFYNVYAHRVGFSTRISVMHRSRRDGSVMSRQFVCAKEGFRTYRGKNEVARADTGTGDEDSGRGRRTRAVTRVGCKAMIRVKKQDNGKWTVTKLETAHNHPLVPANQSHCLRPHKPLSECGKQRPFGGQRNGGTPLAIEPLSTPFTPLVHRIGIPQVAPQCNPDGIGSGTRVILDYVKRMQAEDPAFFYAMQFVEGHPVGNVFWADARARMAYKDFGDAVVLDDYCKRNKHELPLVTFTGVNHHCQPVLFGCAIIADNTETSFVWLFETFLLAMSGKHPTSLTVEYDNAAPSAASKVFTQTRLRFCKWHIRNEAQDKLSHVLNAFPSFHGEFIHCIDMSETVDEFEASWKAIISKVGSQNSEWLDSLYNCRHQWVPLYLRDTFFGDVSLKQQCASRNSLFEGYISANTDSQSFIQQYEKALDCCYEKEVKEEFETKYSLPDIKTSSPMEKQGAELYTRSMFLKFQQELIDASVCAAEKVKVEGNVSIYKVTKSEGTKKPFIVHFSSPESSATCSCRMFEYFGIVCKHILSVFGAQGVSALPAQYFVKRWTKNAMDRSSSKKVDEISRVQEPKEEHRSSTEDGVHSPTWRYNSLCREALRYAEEGASSLEVYIVAMQALQEAANRVNLAKRGIGQVAPLAVMPIAVQPPENFGQVQEISSGKQKKRRRSSNNSKGNFTSNQLMYVQQPVNFLFADPGSSSALPGPSQLVAAAPVSLTTQYGQTSGANHSVDNNGSPAGKFSRFPDQNASASAPSSGNVQGGETKSTGTAAQIKEIHELSQAHGNSGCSVNALNSNTAPHPVTVPIGLCPSMDGSKISAAGMNSLNPGDVSSNGKVSIGLHQAQSSGQQPATQSQTKTPDSIDSRGNSKGSSIRAAAIAASARIASPSDAASIIKAAQSKAAIHIKPRENLPDYLKPLAPKPLTSLPPVDASNVVHASPGYTLPGQLSFGDSLAAKDAIFGSSDGSDDESDDDNTDDDEDEGLTGDDAEDE